MPKFSQSKPDAATASAKPVVNTQSGGKVGVAKAAPFNDDPSSQEWLQGQVDRLVGEIQRSLEEPFTPWLLDALWSIPLEEQHLVLLGAAGTQPTVLEGRAERAKRIWKLMEDEVRVRGGFSTKSRDHPVDPSKKSGPKAGPGVKPV